MATFLESFIPGMVLGKSTMFGVANYVGYDINGLINHPERMLIILIMIVLSFVIGKKLSSTMMNNNIINA